MNKNNTIIGLAGLLVIGLIVISITGTPAQADTKGQQIGEATRTASAQELPDTSKGYQEILLTFENYEYQLSPSTLVKDVPVRMEVDLNSVYGCMRDVVISAFDVRKYVREGDNIIEFTPDKTGTFNIACSMNMGRGTFKVAEADGSANDYTETQAAPSAGIGGSCGGGQGGAGGCGCGGAA